MTNETTAAEGAQPAQPRLLFQRVQKREGHLVDFDRRKIAAAILKAMRAVNRGDSALADQMADCVIIHLAREYEDQLLHIEDIQDAVETVLMEQGLGPVAKAYILYRNERSRRRQIKIQTAGRPRPPRDLLNTEVERTAESELVAWNRERIVEALVRETGLAREAAMKISREVEEQLIYSRAATITTDLIRELVNAKLVEHGYTHERTLHARLGVPLFDCERALTSGPVPPESTDLALAGVMVREFAMRRVFPEDVVEAHLRGEVTLQGLDRVTRPQRLCLSPAYLLKFGLRLPHALAHARPARHASTLVAHAVKASTALQSALVESIAWDAFDVVFAPLVADLSDRELDQLTQTVVFDFSQQSEAQGGRPLSVDLHIYGCAPPRLAGAHALGAGGAVLPNTYAAYNAATRRFASALVRAFAQGDGRGHPFICPRLTVHLTRQLLEDPDSEGFLAEAVSLARLWGTPEFVFDREHESPLCAFVLPGAAASRYPWQHRGGQIGGVTLNLVQAALLAGSDRAKLYNMLTDFCRLAIKALLARRAFLERLLAQGDQGPLAMLCAAPDGDPLLQPQRAIDSVSLLGLDELMALHCDARLGDTAEAAAFADEVLALIAAELERYAGMHGVAFLPGAAVDARASVAAAAHDRRHFALGNDAPHFYTPAGQMRPATAIEPSQRLAVEGALHKRLPGRAITLLRASALPPRDNDAVQWLRELFHRGTCRALAISVTVTLCQTCGAVTREQCEVCPNCASARVIGLKRLLGPLEALPRWDGRCGPLVAATAG